MISSLGNGSSKDCNVIDASRVVVVVVVARCVGRRLDLWSPEAMPGFVVVVGLYHTAALGTLDKHYYFESYRKYFIFYICDSFKHLSEIPLNIALL